MKHRITRQQQLGALLMTMVFILVVVGLLATVVTRMLSSNAASSYARISAVRAGYIAHGGLEQAIEAMLNTDRTRLSTHVACADINSDSNVNQGTLGKGSYTVSATHVYPSPTTLSASLDDSSTTITVASTSGYESKGRIMLDNEVIDYTGTTATTFTGATRGAANTTAASHASGTPVGQNACVLTAIGGVPSATTTNSYSRRKYSRQITQLPEGWAVGESDGSKTTVLRWNGASWQATGPHSGVPDQQMNAISVLSYDDIWAVGNTDGSNANLNHWNGSSWTNYTPNGSAIPRNLNSVSCANTDSCRAVGDADSGYAFMLKWNGTNWRRVDSVDLVGVPNQNLNSVFCPANNTCWAVGDNDGSNLNINRLADDNWENVTAVDNVASPLNSVYCNSSTDCVAVGDAEGGRALIMEYDGTNWTRLASGQQTSVANANLNKVFCLSSSECWAVGAASGGEANINKWDGSNWAEMSTSELNGIPALNLTDIYCSNSNDCWAVGQSSITKSTIVHWDGSKWTQFDDGNLGTEDLYGVGFIEAPNVSLMSWQDMESAS